MQGPDKHSGLGWRVGMSKGGFLRAAWKLAWPFWMGEERWSARLLLGAVIALNLSAVWLNVRLNSWNNDFYNALQEYDWPKFWWQFAIFGMIAASLIVVAVYQQYLRQILQIRWRRWMTERYLKDWLSDQAYYRMQFDQSSTDNPDQRISDDLDRFTSISLALSIGLLNSVVTLFSFLFILWTLSGALHIPLGGDSGFDIPGYMVIAAIIYAAGGTWLTQKIGNPLVPLLFNQQRYEADFRFSLVRLREHAESVAFYGGESREYGVFQNRFTHCVLNWWNVIRRRKKLTWFTSSYQQLAIVFPFIVAAPRYFAKEIQLGGLMQISSAFGQVQDSLSFIVTSYTEIAGLWPFGRGNIRVGDGHALFLPQRPYLPLGTLGDAIAYPELDHQPRRAELEAALRAVGLAYLIDQLDVDGNWAQRLSGGEQQRLGFARILLVRPEIVFLDEATSALDEAAEASLYRLLREADWRPTIVSVGHHGTLRRFHEAIVDLGRPPVSHAAAAGN